MALIGLGVGGGIGAYKALEVARGLQKNGHDVVALLTRNARRFITPLTFEAITHRPVLMNQFAPGVNTDIEHIAVANDIALLVVAPATANILAKFAHGIADDYLSTLFLATPAPVLLAPAMNTRMLEHPAVQENARILAARGVRFVDPGAGYLACGWIGKGRLAEPAEIVAAAEEMLAARRDPVRFPRFDMAETNRGNLTGSRLVVTAGPTFEDIDAVRFIGNRSSGRMGYALAAEASRRGAMVSLISGPTHLPAPEGVSVESVRSAAEMHAAVTRAAAGADAVIMAAAVADYAPDGGAIGTKKAKAEEAWSLRLTRTRDILAELGAARNGGRPVLVGFAAQTGDPVPAAVKKLASKHADLIVANDVSKPGSGFDVDTNEITLVDAHGAEPLPLMSKDDAAGAILDRVARLLAAKIVAQ
ncbi:MAG TPA: bifunctional phosphopantothenoylcysteine decarboxylase/phosphopantothenate--cysteine ligase CoaBC [Vicinamibacterales bacterium]|nr:bifunctional phosphopantothenoylcysteine decarboxylase/phosphopantothenate--cysteine ligase CoaBC [Vicinamibacterales bacterium]